MKRLGWLAAAVTVSLGAWAGDGQAQSLGHMQCSALLSDPLARLSVSTPATHWLHGYLVGRKSPVPKPGEAAASPVSMTSDEAVRAWMSVRAFCTAHPDLTLVAASMAFADQSQGDQPRSRTEPTGSEDEEGCYHIKAVDEIVPGHFEELFGPWLDGFLIGRQPAAFALHDPDLEAAWLQVNATCRASPGDTLLTAASKIDRSPGG